MHSGKQKIHYNFADFERRPLQFVAEPNSCSLEILWEQRLSASQAADRALQSWQGTHVCAQGMGSWQPQLLDAFCGTNTLIGIPNALHGTAMTSLGQASLERLLSPTAVDSLHTLRNLFSSESANRCNQLPFSTHFFRIATPLRVVPWPKHTESKACSCLAATCRVPNHGYFAAKRTAFRRSVSI